MKRKPKKPISIREWVQRCEALIQVHSTPARTRGKYKGHGSTDSVAWISDLVNEAWREIRRTRKGMAYDENMALASLVGLILATWYSNVHRAKAFDPNRPLKLRRRALEQRAEWLKGFFGMLNSDRMMGEVWGHQEFNLPYGKKAKGGKFV